MENKNYVVVGGSSGIGLALVKLLAQTRSQVFVLSRTRDETPTTPNVHHLSVDVLSDEMSFSDLPDEIHGLAYCPGSISLKPFRALKPAQFRQDFEINLLGAVKVLQGVQRALKKASKASVVLFSTVAVRQGMAFHASVAAAKGAVEGFTRSLAAEWAPQIRVNCIAPSLTDSPMASRLLSTPEKREASAKRHPLRKVGEAKEIAELAHFLLSEKSSWMSGQVIGIDGGLSTLRV